MKPDQYRELAFTPKWYINGNVDLYHDYVSHQDDRMGFQNKLTFPKRQSSEDPVLTMCWSARIHLGAYLRR